MQPLIACPGSAGYNVCIFCYGQTGSGKTHTMAGSDIETYEGRGINYRALDDLFALNEARRGEVRLPTHEHAWRQARLPIVVRTAVTTWHVCCPAWRNTISHQVYWMIHMASKYMLRV